MLNFERRIYYEKEKFQKGCVWYINSGDVI